MAVLVGEVQGSIDTLLIILAGSGGLIGAIVALAKIGSDKSSAAVTQAQGAMETMQEVNQSLHEEIEYWRGRFKEERVLRREAESKCREMERKVADLEMRWGDLG